MVDMAGPMGDMEATDMARGRLRPLLMLSLVIEAMDTAAMADLMEDMEAMDMARGRLRLLLMLSLVIEAMDTAAMADLMEDMVDMAMASEYLSTQTCFSNPTLLFMLQLNHV